MNIRMRVLVMNFQSRGGWLISFLAEDAKTPIGRPRSVRDARTMIARSRASCTPLRADLCSMEASIYNWARGGDVWIDPTPAQCRALGIR